MRNSLFGFSCMSWKTSLWRAGLKISILDCRFIGFRARCFSSRRSRASWLTEGKLQSSKEERDAFFVVRKGNVIGIYKNLSDCQAQVSSSVCDPPVSVYKGYSLHKEVEDYLASHGLKNALYTLNAVDVKDDLLGMLVPCPFQESARSNSLSTEQSEKHPGLAYSIEAKPASSNHVSCILECDGASRGNPGTAGAGAILRAENGNVIFRLREGLGIATCNAAEYQALILGMKYALRQGFQQIHVQTDSVLVYKQVQGLWRIRNQNMANFFKEVKGLEDMFLSFSISHVKREFNSEADAEAKLAVDLPIGEVFVETGLT